MANTRIRYNKVGSTLTSRRIFSLVVDGNMVDAKVVLDTNDMTYTVINLSDNSSVIGTGDNTKNLSVLKIQAKDALRELGYEFGAETRNRGVASNTEETVTPEVLVATTDA